jgi:hypothetical protein
MKPRIQYVMEFLNFEEQTIKVVISDMSDLIDDAQDSILYSLPAAEDPLHISTTDNSEDKFTPIKAKKATIKFRNSTNINYSTFARGEDDRFPVTVTCNDLVVFKGFLEQSDIFEPFLPQIEQDVTLIAIDGLAYLKDIALTDFDDETPIGQNRIIDYIAWCLNKTGLELDIHVVNNLREQDAAGKWQGVAVFTAPDIITAPSTTGRFWKVGHIVNISGSGSNDMDVTVVSVSLVPFVGYLIEVAETLINEGDGPTITFTDKTDGGNIYASCFLDAKTFEDEIGTCENCQSVLEKILGFDCFITQWKSAWWIWRVKEFRNDFTTYLTKFDHEGTLLSSFESINFEKALGLQRLDTDAQPIPFTGVPDATGYFSQENTPRTYDRQIKFAKLTFNYADWREILCNLDYSRGDFIADLPDETVGDQTFNVKSYNLDCWELKRGAGSTATTPNCEAYIKRRLIDDYEKERCILITLPSVQGNPKNYIESSAVPMNEKDKYTISFDWATEVDISGGSPINIPVASLWLEGDDGTFWKMNEDGEWLTTNSGDEFGLNTNIVTSLDFAIDTTEWKSESVTCDPLPTSGKLRLRLNSSGVFPSDAEDDFNIRFANISLEYQPFVNGSYKKYNGQSNTSTQIGNFKANVKGDVFITDVPVRIFKGSLHTEINEAIVPVNSFYEGQEFLYGNDGQNNLIPYGQIQVKAVFNQYRNGNMILQANWQGLDSVSTEGGERGAMDIIHRYFIRDLEPATNQQPFQLVTIDQDWRLCEVKGTLIKVFDNNIGFVSTDDFQFKFIS